MAVLACHEKKEKSQKAQQVEQPTEAGRQAGRQAGAEGRSESRVRNTHTRLRTLSLSVPSLCFVYVCRTSLLHSFRYTHRVFCSFSSAFVHVFLFRVVHPPFSCPPPLWLVAMGYLLVLLVG